MSVVSASIDYQLITSQNIEMSISVKNCYSFRRLSWEILFGLSESWNDKIKLENNAALILSMTNIFFLRLGWFSINFGYWRWLLLVKIFLSLIALHRKYSNQISNFKAQRVPNFAIALTTYNSYFFHRI